MLNWGGLMTVIISSGPYLWPMLSTYTVILTTYPVVCLQRNFGQVTSPLIVPYIILINGDALHMIWNQYFRMGTRCLSGWKGIGELNIFEPLLYMTAHWAWSGTDKLATSALNFIWYLMTTLRLCMKDNIKNLQFGQNWSPRVHMLIRTMS